MLVICKVKDCVFAGLGRLPGYSESQPKPTANISRRTAGEDRTLAQ